MKTFYKPTSKSEEVKLLKKVDLVTLTDSLKFYIDKLSETNTQVGLRYAGDFEGISDLRYKNSNPKGYKQEDFKDWQPGTGYLQTVAKELGIGDIGRVRLLRINPRGCYSFHHDLHTYRVHIPIKTSPGAFMVIWGKLWHLEPGYAYRVRVSEEHTAINTGSEERIHIVFDYCDNL